MAEHLAGKGVERKYLRERASCWVCVCKKVHDIIEPHVLVTQERRDDKHGSYQSKKTSANYRCLFSSRLDIGECPQERDRFDKERCRIHDALHYFVSLFFPRQHEKYRYQAVQ